MKKHHTIILVWTLLLTACGPSQRITNSWISPEARDRDREAYEKIFVMVLTPNMASSFSVEDRMAGVIAARGQEFVLSSAVFPPNLQIGENFTQEQMAEAIKRTGSDCVFIISLLDVKSVDTYHQSRVYGTPYYGAYNTYYGYYRYYSPMVYSPGYYSSDKTYYIETNFYDLEKNEHLWLIQSEAYNPESLDSWFDTYVHQLLDELKNEDLLAK